ncbi:Nuclease-related domain, NERD [Dillenia turbinata]|uniref:Nuclease-related domain, NERD n=1 Tax=Dillenia turbinata TaxID=194707 RepID=A0AAN8Z609_9MAGN
MWVEILCGIVIYKLFRWFFHDDDILEIESSDSDSIFSVASRIEKLYDGKVYVGLRIPDAETGSRQNIDMVLITKEEAVVILVKNFSGLISIDADGSWVFTHETKHKSERHPDPVAEAKRLVSVLESYLEQRGVVLPEGYLSFKVVLPNPKLRTIYSNYFPSEVIPYEQLVQLKPVPRSMLSGWIKGAFHCGKKEMQESVQQRINFVLSTAPTWDRLELKSNKYMLGEFLEFEGKHEDIKALRDIKRSKVGQVIIQKSSMLGLVHSNLQVLYSPRDYRSEGSSASEWKEVTVRSSTEAVFQPQYSNKVRKFKLSSISSLTLIVILVKNFSGLISIDADGSWVSTHETEHKSERHPDPVAEAKRLVSVLGSYLEQRGVVLPEGYLSFKVILPNPELRTIYSNYFPPEVIPYEQLVQLKPVPRSMLSGWTKGAFHGGKKDMQESVQQRINYVLGTAPVWDRLELKSNKYVLGEFLDFEGKHEDMKALRGIKRSKVGRVIIQTSSMLRLVHSNLQVLYSPRDYRREGSSASEWKEVTVGSCTMAVFQPRYSNKVRKIKLSSISSLTLNNISGLWRTATSDL